ncbi:hypothetical protein FRC11_010202 [Ceratobasidium sp. 423]|nr:hypothetical protein FRC11_010202 [Ceratobasidium sp. 423]
MSKPTPERTIDLLPNELYSEVLGYLDEHERTGMLLVSKAYFQRTVGIVWSTVDNLHRLLRLLPVTISNTYTESGLGENGSDVTFVGEVGTKYVRFLAEELPQYESRFRVYASKVTTLNTCNPSGQKYVYVSFEPIMHMCPLAPQLSQIIFQGQISFFGPPIEQAIANMMRLFDHEALRSLAITATPRTLPLEASRYQLAQILHTLEESRAPVERLSLDLDLGQAVAPTVTFRQVLFQGLSTLTELSCQASLVRPGWAPIGDLGLLPNLFHLRLWDWRSVPGIQHVLVAADVNTLFPRLREVVLSQVHPDQAAHLLSSIFPDRLGLVELILLGSEELENQLPEVTNSLLRHRDHLSVLKIAQDAPMIRYWK